MSIPGSSEPTFRDHPPVGGPEGRVAWWIGGGAIAAMLAAAPYRLFELDRFFVPKEVVLLVTAAAACWAAAGLARAPAREPRADRGDVGARTGSGGTAVDRFVDGAFALYLAWSALSAGLAASPWLAARALAITAAGAALFWTARAAARRGAGGRIVGALAAATAVAAAGALLQAYGVRSEYFSVNRAPGGLFGNRNFVAHLCAVGLPLAVYVALAARRFAAAVGAVLAALALGAALVLSRSRGAWLAAAVAVAPVLIGLVRAVVLSRAPGAAGGWRLRPGRALLLAAAVGGGAAAAVRLPNALDWRSDSPYLDSVKGVVDYKGGSGRGRLAQWENSARLLAEHPVLGVGPGNWSVRYPAAAPAGDPSLTADGTTANPWPSSDWVAVASERGVVAVAALAAVVVGLAVVGHRGVWGGARGPAPREVGSEDARAREAAGRALAGGALGGVLAAAVVAGAFDAVLLLAAPTVVVWPAAGALAAMAGGGGAGRAAGRGVALARLGAGGLALGAALAGAHLAAMPLYENGGAEGVRVAAVLAPGDYRVRLRAATLALGRGDCGGARGNAEAAHEVAPAAGGARRVLAQCRRRGR